MFFLFQKLRSTFSRVILLAIKINVDNHLIQFCHSLSLYLSLSLSLTHIYKENEALRHSMKITAALKGKLTLDQGLMLQI